MSGAAPGIEIGKGFDEADRAVAAELYWDAFGKKLGVTLGPREKAVRLLEAILDPDYAICAYRDAELLGVAGFKTKDGAFVDGGFADLARVYGTFAALWRAALLALIDRKPADSEFLMDGICVAASARSQGVGGRLLGAIIDEGRARGLTHVRLDVIDTNPDARRLYERKGFRAVGVERLGPLSRVFGFASATRMHFDLAAMPQSGD